MPWKTIRFGSPSSYDSEFIAQKTIKLDDKFALAHFNLGNLYLAFNQLQFADEAFTKALLLKSDDSMAYMNRAITRYLAGSN